MVKQKNEFSCLTKRFQLLQYSIILAGLLSSILGCITFDDNIASEYILYRGQILTQGNVSLNPMINIYAANRDELILEKDGTISKSFVSSSHPDANGSFGVGTTTYLHAKAEHVEQWQCAPLRILIRSDKYLDYYDSLDETALKVLKQNAKGEWVLPSITLIPK